MKMNSKTKKDLSQASVTTVIIFGLRLLEQYFSGNLNSLGLYVVELITMFVIFYLINYFRNRSEEENTAVAESLKKQMEPFVGKVDDMNRIETETMAESETQQ